MLFASDRTWIILHTSQGSHILFVSLPVVVKIKVINLPELVRWCLSSAWIVLETNHCSTFFFISLPVVVKVFPVKLTVVVASTNNQAVGTHKP